MCLQGKQVQGAGLLRTIGMIQGMGFCKESELGEQVTGGLSRGRGDHWDDPSHGEGGGQVLGHP